MTPVLGVGQKIDRVELDQMASSSGQAYVVQDFNALTSQLTPLVKSVCSDSEYTLLHLISAWFDLCTDHGVLAETEGWHIEVETVALARWYQHDQSTLKLEGTRSVEAGWLKTTDGENNRANSFICKTSFGRSVKTYRKEVLFASNLWFLPYWIQSCLVCEATKTDCWTLKY